MQQLHPAKVTRSSGPASFAVSCSVPTRSHTYGQRRRGKKELNIHLDMDVCTCSALHSTATFFTPFCGSDALHTCKNNPHKSQSLVHAASLRRTSAMMGWPMRGCSRVAQ